MKIILGVRGSIAAYRSPDMVKALVQQGHGVRVILSRSAEALVSSRALSTFSGQAVLSNDVFDKSFESTDHISQARWADVILVYGATADFLARYAHGFADDFLGLQLLATTGPVLVAPAMNPSMWSHPAVQENVRVLKSRGTKFVGPIYGTVACDETGVGHIADIDEISSALRSAAAGSGQVPKLAGKKILISAGPMQSSLDPARLLQNRSSGRMGIELARSARSAGAEVTLMLGPTSAEMSKLASSFKLLRFTGAADYETLLMKEFPNTDIFLSAAAVLDFEFLTSEKKLDRSSLSGPDIKLGIRPIKDFVAQVARSKKPQQRVIAFAAETGTDDDILKRAEMKLRDKGADLLAVNPVRPGLGPEAENNLFWILRPGQAILKLGPALKAELAAPLLLEITKTF